MIGDHIRALKGGRWEHGIDCGDQTVIHLREEAGVAPADRVRRTYRPEFLAGAAAVEVVTHRERVYAGRQVVARAFSRARDASLAAMFRDSAAFAAWCKTGRLPDGQRETGTPAAMRPASGARRATPVPAGAARVRPARKPVRAKAAPAKAAKKRPAARKKAPAAKKASARAGRKDAGKKPAGARKAAPRKPASRKARRR